MSAGAQTAPVSADTLLQAADQARNPPGSFFARTALTEYRDGVLASTAVIQVYSKPGIGSDQYDSLLRYQQPARDAGKLVLRNGVDLWFFDPASGSTVRISPDARLLGDASISDVMTTNLSRDYSARLVGTDQVKDAAQTMRTCVHLHLLARLPDAAFAQADIYIDATNQEPVKVVFETAEQRLLKTVYFRAFKPMDGRARPTETVIVDGVRPSWITVVAMLDYKPFDIPNAWLQRDFLPRLPAQ